MRTTLLPARRTFCVAVGLCLALGCDAGDFTANVGGEGPAHRAQRLALTPEQELRLGREAYREVLSHPEKYGRALPTDRPEVQRVRNIARRIVQAADIEPLQREV